MPERGLNSVSVLILAASTRDAQATNALLDGFRIESKICSGVDDLILRIGVGTGAIILAKEALSKASIEQLTSALNGQPKWSSLPIIMLVGSGDLSNPLTLELLRPLPNMTFLERPVRQRAFISIVQAALADRKRQYELRDSLNEAVEANRAKSEFLANMSHEIRTPLGAILGFSELVGEPGLSETDRKLYLDTIRRNGQLLTALINDILDLAKVEAGRLQIELIEVSLREVLSEVVSALEPRASAKGVRLVLSRDPRVPDLIATDPVRLKQILLNIAGNAIKFTAQGSVTISVSAKSESDGTGERELLVIEVVDTGIGIKPEQASLLFQSFAQADTSITRRFGGTGLGLVLSQKLARALGGDLRLSASEYGAGSTFEISTALRRVHGVARPKMWVASSEQSLRLPPSRVLVVDDSKDNQLLISRLLVGAGAKVYTADDGNDGVEKALELDPDVVLMDVQMPGLSGIDATVKLRKLGFTKPIVALTAHALKGDREQCLNAGCSNYLTKPVQKSELFEVVKDSLKTATRVATTVG